MSYNFTKTNNLYDISTKSPPSTSEKSAISKLSLPKTSFSISFHTSPSFYVLQPQQLELKRNKLPLMLTFLAFDIKRNILKTPEQTIKLFSLQNYDCRKADPGKRFKSCKSHCLTVTQNRTDSSFGFFLRPLFIPRFFKVSRRHAPRKTRISFWYISISLPLNLAWGEKPLPYAALRCVVPLICCVFCQE